MLKYFMQLTQTNRGQSAGRLGFLFSIFISNVVLWSTWLGICIYKHEMVNIPEGVVMVYAAAQGLSFAGKAAQSFADKSKGGKSVDKG